MVHSIQTIFVERDITDLSLSVLPIDNFIPETYPIGAVKIDLKEEIIIGIKNYSGYYIFSNLKDGEYTIRIESEYYLSKEYKVTIPSYGSPPDGLIYSEDEDIKLYDYMGVIVATVDLRPNPSYPFPKSSNLIRGLVYKSANIPIHNAVVKVLGKSVQTLTTEKGEYVLYFSKLTQEDVIVLGDRKFIRGNGTQEIKIQAEHPDFGSSSPISLELEEGTTKSVNISYP